MIFANPFRALLGTFLFAATAATAALPSAPTTIAPEGTLNTTSPTFSWNSVTDNRYELLVQNTAGVAIYEGFFAGWAHCGLTIGEVCSYASETPLRQGSTYNWFVRGINNEGAGPWSSPRTVTIDAAAVVAPPIAVRPDGVAGNPREAGFTWKRVLGNISYQVLVQNTSGVVFDRTYSAAEVDCVISHAECGAFVTGLTPNTYN